jgi:hypothetical protein
LVVLRGCCCIGCCHSCFLLVADRPGCLQAYTAGKLYRPATKC